MPDFAYIARDGQGERVTGSLSAASQREVVNILSDRSLFPLEVTVEKTAKRFTFGRPVKGQAMALIYAQMAALLRSGVPLLRSLDVLRNQAAKPILKEVLGDVRDRIEEGETLGDGMARHTTVFSEMAVNMVRAGGEGGFLEEALERVAIFSEQQEDLKSRTIGALAYPVFLAIVGSLVITGLIVFIVPQFDSMFDRLRQMGQLPFVTDWLLNFSAALRKWGLYIIVALVVFLFVVRSRLQTESGKRTRDLVKIRLPLFGIVFRNFAVARFCRVLGTLLRNGVPILTSLDISREAAGNRILSEAIGNASENITAGETLAGPLGASGHFPDTVVEMITVAEESNTLDSVLVDIADGLEKRTSRALDLAVRLHEPIMLLLMAGIVLFVVVALLVPIIRMSSTFG